MNPGSQPSGALVTVDRDRNGRLKLTFPQIAWLFSILVALGGFWAQVNWRLSTIEDAIRDMKGAYVTRVELNLLRESADKEHRTTDQRLDRLEDRRSP